MKEDRPPWPVKIGYLTFLLFLGALAIKLFPSEIFVRWEKTSGEVIHIEEVLPSSALSGRHTVESNQRCWVVYSKYMVGGRNYITKNAFENLDAYRCVDRENPSWKGIPYVSDPIVIWFDTENANHAVYNNSPYIPRFLIWLFILSLLVLLIGIVVRPKWFGFS